MTSNQALGRIKRIFGIKKAGHTGTLDPMATGLLVICLGHATRICAHLLDADKGYEARVHLGVITDTEDAEGQVVETRVVPALSLADIEAVLAGFRGEIEQVPPMYSALKHQGERLYALARRGESVERPPRRVRIDELEMIDSALDDPHAPGFSLRVACSKGTYIRSLVRDIGQALGCGAHLSALRRTHATPFDIADAHSLDQLEAMSEEARHRAVLPIWAAVPDWPVIALTAAEHQDFLHGRSIELAKPVADGPSLRWVCVRVGDLCVGLGQISGHRLQPKAVFV